NLAYQEAFGIFGQERNLGIAANLFYNENAAGFFQTIRNFQNTTDSPAYLWDYRTRDRKNNRKQTSLNAKIEYRLSENAKITINLVGKTGYESAVRIYDVRAFTNQSVGATGNAGILPGYTDHITQVRAVPASTIDVSSEKIEWFT